jgi:exosortase F-associated protein
LKLFSKYTSIVTAILLLVTLYIFQRFDYWLTILRILELDQHYSPTTAFVVNKTLRLVFNDCACFVLIYAIFREKTYLKIAFYLLLIELFFVLPIYFVLKLQIEGPTEISSPLFSQIHRIIVNPILMLLLMAGFWIQKRKAV